MSECLLQDELNYSQLLDLDEEHSLSILDVFELNCSLKDSNNEEDISTLRSENKILANSFSNGLEETNKQWLRQDPIQYYHDRIKATCPDVDCSLFVELFADNQPKSEEEVRALAAARVQQIVESVKKEKMHKSFSCPNLQKLVTSTQSEEDDFSFFKTERNNIFKNETYSKDLNTPEIPVINKQSTFTYYSTENLNALNYSRCNILNESFSVPRRTDETYGTVNQTFTTKRLQKSFSSSCIPSKNDSLLDIELKLDDSVPSEDEVDEMGLPVKRFVHNQSVSNVDEGLSQTIVKYRKLRASLGEPNFETNTEPQTVIAPVKEPPLLCEVKDTQLKKSQPSTSKGPLKALMPIHSMTKQMGVKIMSPFKKKKEQKIDFHSNNASSVLTESFEERIPMASSTPTGGRACRKDSTCGNSSFVRSLSEGRATPVKKQPKPVLNVSYTKSSVQLPKKVLDATVTINDKIEPPKKTALKKIVNQPLLTKPNSKSSMKRPSTAPANPLSSIKAPLSTRLTNQTTVAQKKISKSNSSKALPTKTSLTNIMNPLQTKNSQRFSQINNSKSQLASKLRRPTSAFDKEN